MVEPFRPKRDVVRVREREGREVVHVVPALTLMSVRPLMDAVSVEPLNPKETPLVFESVIAVQVVRGRAGADVHLPWAVDRRCEASRSGRTHAVQLLNVTAERLLLVVPALKFTTTDAVMMLELLIPNVTLFEFE